MSAMWIETPPPPREKGCFAKGCLILTIFLIVLCAAFAVGTFYAVRYLRTNYFPTTQVELPANTTSEEEQRLALAHWKIFERLARAHMPARIEMTADWIYVVILVHYHMSG